MASADVVLHFLWPAASANQDLRTFQVKQLVEGGTETVDLYKFNHPNTGSQTGVTSVERKNPSTERWENAGHIDWSSEANGHVYFGMERVPMRELRRAKKTSSKSRRFKAAGSEYKWKIADNGADLYCVSTRGKTVAQWSQDSQVLRVTERAEEILDRVVVTLLINVWMKRLNIW